MGLTHMASTNYCPGLVYDPVSDNKKVDAGASALSVSAPPGAGSPGPLLGFGPLPLDASGPLLGFGASASGRFWPLEPLSPVMQRLVAGVWLLLGWL